MLGSDGWLEPASYYCSRWEKRESDQGWATAASSFVSARTESWGWKLWGETAACSQLAARCGFTKFSAKIWKNTDSVVATIANVWTLFLQIMHTSQFVDNLLTHSSLFPEEIRSALLGQLMVFTDVWMVVTDSCFTSLKHHTFISPCPCYFIIIC